MNYKVVFSSIIAYLVFYSCDLAGKPRTLNEILASYKSDSIIKQIPRNSLGEPVAIYDYIRECEKYLRLSNIENGVDSVEIRVWYGFSDTAQLVRIRNLGGKWKGELFTFYGYRKEPNDSIYTVLKEVTSKQPLSGWNKFIEHLIKLQLITLPDAREIKGYRFSPESNMVTVEISTKMFYRLYSYLDPEVYKKYFKEADNIAKILELIESEFQFKRITEI